MKKLILPAIALLAAVAAPFSASAHRGWLMPSSTVLSGERAWVAFDAAASNGVFIADHAPLRLSPQTLSVLAPDGAAGVVANLMQGAYRSTFDVEINKPGTWKIANASAGMNAAWILNGTPGRWRGPAADMAANVPAGATDVVSAPSASRLETFVTLGEPTTSVFAPTGVGIEMVPVTHPNDLVAEEAATFQFLKDGAPYANADVIVARGGLQYRDNPEEMTARTDADGKVSITWPEAGMYWVNTSWRDPAAPAPVEGEGRGGPPVASAQYTAVLQVLP
ncbi:DUF4198 domain-containing protein [Brevundimonas subvibrioides]|uniref:Nickel transport complex, NikM subunit, transmembrane n=1 Tax=Brevundimonas subvibrioides (strain ATCC 15264 / DSM 4735 / LMG 14903 / NBRC 16000 / CB 81) TaxID=633149 RepID=D9QP04_BRESC|nr:DUF4198 domain-containing protein [Brevundimonas subvibrioides]ADL00437.1 Nickel transport complex, NikM subunit, transmembrane [Brevundimonas subvibrioides ATCC 15264]